jgi:hypothetical protein
MTYSQRVNQNGVPLCERNGIQVSSAYYQEAPMITIDSRWLSGNQQAQSPAQSDTANEFKGAIVVWCDWRNEAVSGCDIYNQVINEDGMGFVETHGLDPNGWGIVSNAADLQLGQQMVSDGQGGAIMVWDDARTQLQWDIYAQRVDADGTFLWTLAGEPICNNDTTNKYNPKIVPDGQGGAIITWFTVDIAGMYYDVYAQRIDADGNLLLGSGTSADGVAVCTGYHHQCYPQIVPDGQGGAIISWQDYRGDNGYEIYAQRIDSSGALIWDSGNPEGGIPVCTVENQQYPEPQMVQDGQGGAIITWYDTRNFATNEWDIFAQRIDSTGVTKWPTDGSTIGIPVCEALDYQYEARLAQDGEGGAIIAWQDNRNAATTGWDIYAQRVEADGDVGWTTNGIKVCTADFPQLNVTLVPDGEGGAIIAWDDCRNAYTTSWDIYAQRLDRNGNVK